jgi:hypothetical protein
MSTRRLGNLKFEFDPRTLFFVATDSGISSVLLSRYGKAQNSVILPMGTVIRFMKVMGLDPKFRVLWVLYSSNPRLNQHYVCIEEGKIGLLRGSGLPKGVYALRIVTNCIQAQDATIFDSEHGILPGSVLLPHKVSESAHALYEPRYEVLFSPLYFQIGDMVYIDQTDVKRTIGVALSLP